MQALKETEKKVWSTVQNYTKQIMTGDINSFLKFFHKDYLGWNYEEQMPISKTEIKNELLHLPKFTIISYKLSPVSIQIKNRIAIVHYYYTAKIKDKENKKIISKAARNTDILIEEDNEWVLIGDHVDLIENKTKFTQHSENED